MDWLLRRLYKKSYYIVTFATWIYLGGYGIVKLFLDSKVILPIGYTYLFWLVLGIYIGYLFAFRAINFLNDNPFDKPPEN